MGKRAEHVDTVRLRRNTSDLGRTAADIGESFKHNSYFPPPLGTPDQSLPNNGRPVESPTHSRARRARARPRHSEAQHRPVDTQQYKPAKNIGRMALDPVLYRSSLAWLQDRGMEVEALGKRKWLQYVSERQLLDADLSAEGLMNRVVEAKGVDLERMNMGLEVRFGPFGVVRSSGFVVRKLLDKTVVTDEMLPFFEAGRKEQTNIFSHPPQSLYLAVAKLTDPSPENIDTTRRLLSGSRDWQSFRTTLEPINPPAVLLSDMRQIDISSGELSLPTSQLPSTDAGNS